tara:strand:+ start:434 stop:868 length:435 start_codon:yes stop_codon:yes gene_type:complete
MVTNNDSFEAVNEPEESVEASVDSIESNEPLPMGTDSSFLFAGREERVLEIVHAGQRWHFKYKDLSWGQKNQCIDEAQKWDPEAGFQFSVQKYYAAALTRMLTDTPIHPVTETTLNQLDRSIGEKLIALVPQPVEQDLDEVKKA